MGLYENPVPGVPVAVRNSRCRSVWLEGWQRRPRAKMGGFRRRPSPSDTRLARSAPGMDGTDLGDPLDTTDCTGSPFPKMFLLPGVRIWSSRADPGCVPPGHRWDLHGSDEPTIIRPPVSASPPS